MCVWCALAPKNLLASQANATGQHSVFVIIKQETGAYAISLVKAKIQLIIEHSNAEWIDPASIPYGVVFVGVTMQSTISA